MLLKSGSSHGRTCVMSTVLRNPDFFFFARVAKRILFAVIRYSFTFGLSSKAAHSRNKPKIVQVYGDAQNSDDDDDGGTAGATTSSYCCTSSVAQGGRHQQRAPAECIPRVWSSRRR